MIFYSSVTELESYIKNHHKKHLIFDMDWTLLTLHINWDICVAEMYRKLSRFDPLAMRHLDQNDISYALYNELIKKHGQVLRDLIQDYYEEFELSNLKKVDFNLPLIRFLSNNKGKFAYYALTGNQPKVIIPALRKKRILTLFKKIVCAPDIHLFKPDPEGIFKIMGENPIKSEWLMIGDSRSDKRAAENAHIDYFKLLYCSLPEIPEIDKNSKEYEI